MPAPPLGLCARGVISRVIDGDTIEVTLAMPISVRLLECRAAETRGDEKDAGFAAKEIMERMAKPGDPVTVHIPSDGAKVLASVFSFGRPLGNIWLEGDEDSLSEHMVASGHATRDVVKK
jgi:endonuclease YncB( thermonuclease family)